MVFRFEFFSRLTELYDEWTIVLTNGFRLAKTLPCLQSSPMAAEQKITLWLNSIFAFTK